MGEIMELQNILKDEYINYFCAKPYAEKQEVLFKFLDDMILVSEQIEQLDFFKENSPFQILKSINQQYCFCTDFLDNIKQVVEKSINDLSKTQIFAILWYFSCKNIIIFEQGFYFKIAKQGYIGKLLFRLKILQKNT